MNTRETAMLVWIVLALGIAVIIPSLRVIVIDGVKIATKPFVATMLAASTLLAVAITICLAWFGYWRAAMIPTTAAWFVGTAIVGTFSMGGVDELRRLATRTVAFAAVVEFVSNAYTFPLPAELLLVPFIVILVTLTSFADRRPEFAVSAVSRAEVIRILAQDRSISEIEVIAPELGKLSTMHASDIVQLAGDFDSLLHLAGLPATESPRVTAELHGMSAVAGLSLSDAVQAFVALVGGAEGAEDEGQKSDSTVVRGEVPSTRSPESGKSRIWNQVAIGLSQPPNVGPSPSSGCSG